MGSIVPLDHQNAHIVHLGSTLIHLDPLHLANVEHATLVHTVFTGKKIHVLSVSSVLEQKITFVQHVRMGGQLQEVDRHLVILIALAVIIAKMELPPSAQLVSGHQQAQRVLLTVRHVQMEL